MAEESRKGFQPIQSRRRAWRICPHSAKLGDRPERAARVCKETIAGDNQPQTAKGKVSDLDKVLIRANGGKPTMLSVGNWMRSGFVFPAVQHLSPKEQLEWWASRNSLETEYSIETNVITFYPQRKAEK